MIHTETTEPTKNGIAQSYAPELTVILYLTEVGLTVASWREVKTSAPAWMNRERQSENSNSTSNHHKHMKYYFKQYT